MVPDIRYPPSSFSSVHSGVPLEPPQGGGMGTSPGMSVSWPRSRGGPTTFMRASHQISADASVAVGGGYIVCVCVRERESAREREREREERARERERERETECVCVSVSMYWMTSGQLYREIMLPSSQFYRAVQGSVRTNVIRPLSKPRVRNPITSLAQKQQQQQQLQAVPRHSPTQLEQEFLLSSDAAATAAAALETGPTSWMGEGLDEEEYYTIPEDTAVLDSSLSSSLCSLYGNSRDLDTAKAKEVSSY